MHRLGYTPRLMRLTLRNLFRQSRSLDSNVESSLEPLQENTTTGDNKETMQFKATLSSKRKLQHQVELIYQKYNPEKLVYKNIIDKLIDKYSNGNEVQLLDKMKKKYYNENDNNDENVKKLFEWNDGDNLASESTSVTANIGTEQDDSGLSTFAMDAIASDKTSMHFYDFPSVGAFLFGATFSDLDQDSWPDLVLSGDFGTSSMQWNQGDGTFIEGHFDFLEDVLDK